ncbi:hypothetical protein BJF90_13760 [Pseudonocardia sp. CNS-004]|nr:hypothetical protein BJF90_13760 [Pseudonocardia sp. CNS-004]
MSTHVREPRSDFRSVAVLGLGLMGRGIAQVIAQAGIPVVVLETGEDRLAAGVGAIADFLAEGVRRGKVTPEQRERRWAGSPAPPTSRTSRPPTW